MNTLFALGGVSPVTVFTHHRRPDAYHPLRVAVGLQSVAPPPPPHFVSDTLSLIRFFFLILPGTSDYSFALYDSVTLLYISLPLGATEQCLRRDCATAQHQQHTIPTSPTYEKTLHNLLRFRRSYIYKVLYLYYK
jgi:hypothetical protein